jgi:uroporphyrin-3 C-methyltransferase
LHEAISKTNATVAAANEEIAGLKGGFGELRDQVTSRLDAVEQTQNETLATIKQAQKELSDAIGRNRDYWTLSEVEHIVNLANRQVNLERDRAKALASLTSASVRLEGIDSADVVSVREAIENDINALREAESVDVEGASITLNRLARNVGKLPTAEPGIRRSSDSQPNEETEAADDGAWESVKDTASAALAGLRNLVVVRRDGEVVAPLLPPDQSFFLQQNLRLKLETANLALLRQDNEIYHASLADAAAWTEQYFDTSANRTQQFLADVQELDTHNIAPDLPDISGSLDAVRSLVR